MKKFLSLLLVMVMLFSMSMLVACGGETADVDEGNTPVVDGNDDATTTTEGVSTTTTTTAANASPFPEALTDVAAIPVPTGLDYTMWTLSGGMVDGVEMEEADVQAILDACGGTLMFMFEQAGAAKLINGNGPIDGTYSVVAEGYFIDAAFTGDYSYYGVFTTVEEVPVLILSNKNDPTIALYMTMLDER